MSAWPDDPELLRWLRRFLALKLWTTLWIIWPDLPLPTALSTQVVALGSGALASLAMVSDRFWRTGVAGWIVLMLGVVVGSFPFTRNHYFLETAVLAILALHHERAAARPGTREALCLLVASLWIYAGVQKLAAGAYTDGEMMALYAVFDAGPLGEAVRQLLGRLGADVSPWPRADLLTAGALGLDAAAVAGCVALGFAVPIVELLGGALVLARATRPLGVVLLYAAQVGVAVATLELDFAVSGLALVGLLHGGAVAPRYAALMGLVIAKTAWTVAGAGVA
jgi:hypothetical protein